VAPENEIIYKAVDWERILFLKLAEKQQTAIKLSIGEADEQIAAATNLEERIMDCTGLP